MDENLGPGPALTVHPAEAPLLEPQVGVIGEEHVLSADFRQAIDGLVTPLAVFLAIALVFLNRKRADALIERVRDAS